MNWLKLLNRVVLVCSALVFVCSLGLGVGWNSYRPLVLTVISAILFADALVDEVNKVWE